MSVSEGGMGGDTGARRAAPEAVDVAAIRRIRRDTDAREVALAAYDRLLALLEELSPGDWQRSTECAPWSVSDMVGHLLGAAEANASFPTLLRQQLHGFRHRSRFGGNALDAANDLQVRDHADLTPDERVEELRRLAPLAVEGRMRLPGLLRRIDVPLDAGGSAAPGTPTRLNLGHLMDAVFTRDVWLHRIDIARATDRPVDTDSDVDRRIVEDIVAEWAGRHGEAFELVLHGPAGGRFRQGTAGVRLEDDAVGFCRALSGRAPAEGLLRTRVLF